MGGSYIVRALSPSARRALSRPFAEEYRRYRLPRGRAAASRWYWGQVFGSLVHAPIFTSITVLTLALAIGNIYAALRRLTAKGYVSARLGEPTAERGGRAKRYFKLQADGSTALERSREFFLTVLEGLPETRA